MSINNDNHELHPSSFSTSYYTSYENTGSSIASTKKRKKTNNNLLSEPLIENNNTNDSIETNNNITTQRSSNGLITNYFKNVSTNVKTTFDKITQGDQMKRDEIINESIKICLVIEAILILLLIGGLILGVLILLSIRQPDYLRTFGESYLSIDSASFVESITQKRQSWVALYPMDNKDGRSSSVVSALSCPDYMQSNCVLFMTDVSKRLTLSSFSLLAPAKKAFSVHRLFDILVYEPSSISESPVNLLSGVSYSQYCSRYCFFVPHKNLFFNVYETIDTTDDTVTAHLRIYQISHGGNLTLNFTPFKNLTLPQTFDSVFSSSAYHAIRRDYVVLLTSSSTFQQIDLNSFQIIKSYTHNFDSKSVAEVRFLEHTSLNELDDGMIHVFFTKRANYDAQVGNMEYLVLDQYLNDKERAKGIKFTRSSKLQTIYSTATFTKAEKYQYFLRFETTSSLYTDANGLILNNDTVILNANSFQNSIFTACTFIWYNSTIQSSTQADIVYGSFKNSIVHTRTRLKEDTKSISLEDSTFTNSYQVDDLFAVHELHDGLDENSLFVIGEKTISLLKIVDGTFKRVYDLYVPQRSRTIIGYHISSDYYYILDNNFTFYKIDSTFLKLVDSQTYVPSDSCFIPFSMKYDSAHNLFIVAAVCNNNSDLEKVKMLFISIQDQTITWKEGNQFDLGIDINRSSTMFGFDILYNTVISLEIDDNGTLLVGRDFKNDFKVVSTFHDTKNDFLSCDFDLTRHIWLQNYLVIACGCKLVILDRHTLSLLKTLQNNCSLESDDLYSSENYYVSLYGENNSNNVFYAITNTGEMSKLVVGGWAKHLYVETTVQVKRGDTSNSNYRISKVGNNLVVADITPSYTFIYLVYPEIYQDVFRWALIGTGLGLLILSFILTFVFFKTRKALYKKQNAEKQFEDTLLKSEFNISSGDFDDSFMIKIEDLEFTERLSEGGFAIVFKGKFKGTEVAIKKMKLSDGYSEDQELFQKEVFLLKSLRHPNVLAFIGVCLSTSGDLKHQFIITEFMENGSLDHYTKKLKGKFLLEQKLDILLDICKGMMFLHYKGILHRDLKPQNVLINRGGTAKIGDFGISRVADIQSTMTGHCGTMEYIAPECLQEERYTEKCDVYSFAIMMYELLFECKPYENQDFNLFTIALKVINGLRPIVPFNMEDSKVFDQFTNTISTKLPRTYVAEVVIDYISLMKQCWASLDSERPSFEQIFEKIKEFRQRIEYQ